MDTFPRELSHEIPSLPASGTLWGFVVAVKH